MSAKSLTIFLASPLELEKERVLIGSHIGYLNTLYSPEGKFVRLNKWEDYPAYYTGTRTQTTYNHDLVEPSDIVIILLYNRAGVFTKEETQVAINSNKRIFIGLKRDGKPISANVQNVITEIKQYQNYKGIFEFQDSSTILTDIEALIFNELGSVEENSSKIKIMDNGEKEYHCYLAFSDKLHYVAEELRDRLRAYDTKRIERGQRCLVLPFKNYEYIPYSKFNQCIYLDAPNFEVQCESGLMFEESTSDNKTPYLHYKLYEQGKYNAYKINFDNAYEGLFPKTTECIINDHSCVELKELTETLIKDLKEHHDEYYYNVQPSNRDVIVNGALMNNGNRVKLLPRILTFINEHSLKFLKSADQLLSKISSDAWHEINNLRIFLEVKNTRDNLSSQYNDIIKIFRIINTFLIQEVLLNSTILSLYQNRKYEDILDKITFKDFAWKFGNKIIDEESEKEALEKLNLCNLRLKSMFYSRNRQSKNKLGPTLEERLKITSALFQFNQEKYNDHHVISHVLKVLSILHPTTERSLKSMESFFTDVDAERLDTNEDCIFRFEYAQYLQSVERYEDAMKHLSIGFEKLPSHFERMTNINYDITKQIVDAIEWFIANRINSGQFRVWISVWENALSNIDNKTGEWRVSFLIMSAMKLRTLNLNSEEDTILGKHAIEELVKHEFDVAFQSCINFDHELLKDLAYTANVLGCFYIDRYSSSYNESFKDHALSYLSKGLRILRNMSLDSYIGIYYHYETLPFLAQLYHNMGWMLSKVKDTNALKYYELSYDIRKKMYDAIHDNFTAEILAETSTNLAAYLNDNNLQYDRSLMIAKEAEQIYNNICNHLIEENVMNICKIQQVIATIYYKNSLTRESGIELMEQVWAWASEHPDCSYYSTFKRVSYNILKIHGRI